MKIIFHNTFLSIMNIFLICLLENKLRRVVVTGLGMVSPLSSSVMGRGKTY